MKAEHTAAFHLRNAAVRRRLQLGGTWYGGRVMSKEKTNIAKNRKALHDYFVEDTYECGIVLTGTEVCSLRENSCQLRDCYAIVRNGEVWMNGVHISPYSHGGVWNVDTERRRKLLLHKRQILKLSQIAKEKGYSLIPLSMYFDENNRVKVELGVCRGKKNYDKRATIAERDAKRDIERAMKERYR